MKRNLLYSMLSAMMLFFFATSCDDKTEIVFDHELPQWETVEDAILLEVIMPQATTPEEEIYIVGAFNGGEEAALNNPMWLLEKAANNDVKWGIYLNPSTFADGTSLADGFYFVSATQGVERSALNEEVMHHDNPAVGTRTNITVNRWKAYFDKPQDPSEITHDGYVIYVVDNSGYEELAMYAWGDAEAFGGWPGMAPTGKVEMGGVNYTYFDTGEANKGLNLNLIFNNNNNGSQLGDYNVTLDKDYYLELTPDGVVEFDPASVVTHDGPVIYVVDLTGWEAITLYQWGDVNDLNGAWPGMVPTGKQTINGVEYTYFDMGEANRGLNQNLIFSNNGASQLPDFAATLDRDYYLEVGKKVTEIDPATYGQGGETPDPEPTEPDPVACKIYVENLAGWSNLYLYTWGDKELFGGWPGAAMTEQETIGGRTFNVLSFEGRGENQNLIFNNNEGSQFDAPAAVVLDGTTLYYSVSADGVTAVDPASLVATYKIYVEDQTGWDALAMYAWGDKEIFGGWPGAAPAGTEVVDGVTYYYWEVSGMGENENLILNNNGGGSQLPDFNIKVSRNYFLTATASGMTEK